MLWLKSETMNDTHFPIRHLLPTGLLMVRSFKVMRIIANFFATYFIFFIFDLCPLYTPLFLFLFVSCFCIRPAVDPSSTRCFLFILYSASCWPVVDPLFLVFCIRPVVDPLRTWCTPVVSCFGIRPVVDLMLTRCRPVVACFCIRPVADPLLTLFRPVVTCFWQST